MQTLPTDLELDQLAARLGQRLRAAHDRVVTAESCTGGWIAKTVTDVGGSSDWFDCGMVAYSYEAKQALLRVRPQTLEQFGAVSRECVVEMVSGALVNSGASVAVAVTGIAGPGGGTAEKPVGLVYIGCAVNGEVTVREYRFTGNREKNRDYAVARAITLLREELLKRA